MTRSGDASPSPRRRRASRRRLLAVALALPLAACSSRPHTLDDGEKITRSVLALLASTGEPVCTDDQTEENALAVFREMTLAPRAARADLRWYPPTPLRPDDAVPAPGSRRKGPDGKTVEIREPAARRDALPGLVQFQLDGAARQLSRRISGAERSVAIRQSWVPPGVTARWWPLNRANKSCRPLFVLSNSVRNRSVAFVTVRAEHWGTLYALQRVGDDWRVMAEWSRWLY